MFSIFSTFRLAILTSKQRFCTSSPTVSQSTDTIRDPKVSSKDHWSNIQPQLACPICGSRFHDESVLNSHVGSQHSRLISETLRQSPVQTYKKIFGEENIKSITPSEMRYTNGLVITLQGVFKGCWYSFIDNVGGGPLKALRVKHDLSIAEAAVRGFELANSLEIEENQSSLFQKSKSGDTQQDRSLIRKRYQSLKMKVAKNIWNASVDLKGSLGEKYLIKHRKIPSRYIERLDFRFLPKDVSYQDYREEKFSESLNSYPALLVRAENSEGELTGVQRIFLSQETAQKPKWMSRNKFSRGILQGSAGIVQRGLRGQTVYVAEGPETASSIVASHLHESPDCPVLASLSLANIHNLLSLLISLNPDRVIFAADNDGSGSVVTQRSEEIYQDLSRSLSNHSILMLLVRPPGSKKCDWNDVLKTEGVVKTRRIFKGQLKKSELE